MKTLVILGDIVIVNLLYWIICDYGCGLYGYPFSLQGHILISALYFGIATNSGVVLHYKKVFMHQILTRVTKTVTVFTVAATPLLSLSGLLPSNWKYYALFLICMATVVFAYRLTLRWMVIRYRMSKKQVHNVVLVGSADNMVELAHELCDDVSLGYHIAGFFDDGDDKDFPDGIERLGTPADVTVYLENHREIDECYCGLPSARKEEILPVIHYCENHLVHFYSVPNIRNYLLNRMHFNMIGNVPYLSLHDEPLSSMANRVMKRGFDIIFSLAFLCTLFPFILLIVTVVTKATMPGPVFFRQKRNGLKGKVFYCLKFRSMVQNDDADTVQATKDDPRKTKWGDIMRKTNIDELPQFINVLIGDMSVVGPRPHMVKHTEEYSPIIDKYMIRHWVKPGITGWSQVTGFRGETKELSQMEGRIKRDIWYVEHWSFGLDLYIIYKTVANAIHGEKNAY